MDRKQILGNHSSLELFNDIHALHGFLFQEFRKQFDRSLPFTEEVFDRWERAKMLGFGEGTSIYENSFVFGKVTVGKKCWIGPYSIIDGSGGLSIGDSCTISAGVHIYTHDNVKQTLSGGRLPIEREEVNIGNCTYIGPQSIIKKGISIGNHCIIAANSFVSKNVESNTIVAGNPAKPIGKVIINDNDISFEYF